MIERKLWPGRAYGWRKQAILEEGASRSDHSHGSGCSYQRVHWYGKCCTLARMR